MERVGRRGGGQRSAGGNQGKGREEKSRKGVARRIFTNLTLPATIVLSATGREPHAHQLHGSVVVLRAKTCLRIRK